MVTILIWLGSGFAFSAGVFVGAFLCSLTTSRWQRERKEEVAASIQLLADRNEIGRQQVEVLGRIHQRMLSQ